MYIVLLIIVIIYVFWRLQNRIVFLIIDVLVDFLPGGALGVKDGFDIIGPINKLIRFFDLSPFNLTVLSKDDHPENTKHFIQNGGKWPTHCVNGTVGAQFPKELNVPMNPYILSKGMGDSDAYSAFDKGARIGPVSLATFLFKKKVKTIYVAGIATDFCVKETVMDALKLGFKVYIITDAIKAVNLKPQDGDNALAQMKAYGAIPILSKDITIWKILF